MQLKTNYTVGEIPHSEHPLPQAKRENWLCLNGKWNLQKLNKEGEKIFDGEILVPFSPETLNSGIEEGFVLHTGEILRYERTVFVDGRLLKGITLLHFGAVDSECEVFLNDEKVGEHRGGYTAFTIDVSKQIRLGENKIVVLCRDEGTRNGGAKGKQADKAGGIWYTAQSGIWQTVWLESMPSQRIGNFKITPNAMKKTVKISNLGDIPTKITIYDGGKEILFVEAQGEAVLAYDFMLWSPENPKLYDVVMENEFGDRVETYFGIRSFGMGKDEKGKARLFLNGKPYFFNGLLDQGYWSDGLLTYPSDEAVQDELKLMKDMGFNNISIEINSDDSSLIYIVNSDNDGLLIGKNGKNLQALSLITSQAIKNMLSTSFKFIIDVGEYKLKREKSLEILALNIAKEVQSTKIEAKLDSMNSYERRIIHNVLKNNKYVYTKSEGEEPKRFVIIKPRED